MTRRKPLAGRVVALTRPAGSNGELGALLEKLGAGVVEAPAIRRVPPRSLRALDQAADKLRSGGYAAVAFTSAAAVDAVLGRHRDLRRHLRKSVVAAVGPATAAALVDNGVKPAVIGWEGGAALARPILRALGSRRAGRTVLLPQAEGAREELPLALADAGLSVDAVYAYRTLPVPKGELGQLARALRARRVDAVVVASPSALSSLVRAGVPLDHARLVAIGPTTAAAAQEHGLAVVVARKPSDAELARTLRVLDFPPR